MPFEEHKVLLDTDCGILEKRAVDLAMWRNRVRASSSGGADEENKEREFLLPYVESSTPNQKEKNKEVEEEKGEEVKVSLKPAPKNKEEEKVEKTGPDLDLKAARDNFEKAGVRNMDVAVLESMQPQQTSSKGENCSINNW